MCELEAVWVILQSVVTCDSPTQSIRYHQIMSSNEDQAMLAGVAVGGVSGLSVGGGALIGAGVGSIVPGVGTIAGVVIGAGVGMAAGSSVGTYMYLWYRKAKSKL